MKKNVSKKQMSAKPSATRTEKRDRFSPIPKSSNVKPKAARYADGGMMRGCGAATKGKRYTRSG